MTVYPVGFELADVAAGLAVLVDPARVVVSAEVVEAGATVGEEVVAVRSELRRWVIEDYAERGYAEDGEHAAAHLAAVSGHAERAAQFVLKHVDAAADDLRELRMSLPC